MEMGNSDIKLLKTGANVAFGLALAVYAELADALFPNEPADVKVIENHLTENGVKISLRRLYELNRYRACVKADWFDENLRRDEIRTLGQATTQNKALAGESDGSSPPRPPLSTSNIHLIVAHKIASAAGFQLSEGLQIPYVVNLLSIKRQDPRMATVAFALLLAIPTISCDRQLHLSILEQAKAWPEPILTESLEHFIIELAKRLGYIPAWALTSGSRIFHEHYIESSIVRDYLTLLGTKKSE